MGQSGPNGPTVRRNISILHPHSTAEKMEGFVYLRCVILSLHEEYGSVRLAQCPGHDESHEPTRAPHRLCGSAREASRLRASPAVEPKTP